MVPKFSVNSDDSLRLNTIGSPKDQREALRWSIAKWKFIAAHPQIDYDNGDETCGCCIYSEARAEENESDINCEHCLIAKYTGQGECWGTPYKEWYSTPHDAEKMLAFLRKIYKHYYGAK